MCWEQVLRGDNMQYEYKCMSCGKVNIRYGSFGRIVCDNCGHEFIVSTTTFTVYTPWVATFPNTTGYIYDESGISDIVVTC